MPLLWQKTRDTDGSNGSVELCGDCNQGSMYENGYLDETDPIECAANLAMSHQYFQAAVDKGGKIHGYIPTPKSAPCHEPYHRHHARDIAMTLLDKVIAKKIKLGCEDRYDALKDIKLSLDAASPFDVAYFFDVLVNDSAEDFMIEFMTAYNDEVRHTY